MVDRVLTYRFEAKVDGLKASLAAGGKSVQDFSTKLTGLDKQGEQMRASLDTVAGAAGKVGLAAAASLGATITVAANFEQAMSNVAATGGDAASALDQLREAAIDAGAATAFSASEAAAGIENLLKAGVSAEDVLGGGLSGALDLAAAGELQVADAAEIAATALTQFGLVGADIPHVADLLAAGAGKAQGDVSDLSQAMKQSGLVASQMGVSLEETVGTLSAFASAGLLGSDAGTSFRTMLLRLANPTKESANLMADLGINAYDASGEFVGMASVAGQLQTAFEGKTQAERDSAMATLFGSDAIRAASILYAQGTQGVENWTSQVDDAGYAAETAATRLDNLKGDIEGFTGALETALIGSGEGAQGPLRMLVQTGTDLVNAFNGLPPGVKNSAAGFAALTAAAGGTLWVGNKAFKTYHDLSESLATLTKNADGTSRSIGQLFSAANGARAGAGILLIADQATGASDALGLTNTASLALMGTMVAPGWGTAVGGLSGLLLDMVQANDAATDSMERAMAVMDNPTGFRTMTDAVRDARDAVREFEDELHVDSFFEGSLDVLNPVKGFKNLKNSIEGLFGASDVEELRAQANAIADVAYATRDAANELALAMGAQGEVARSSSEMDAMLSALTGGAVTGFSNTTVAVDDLDRALRSAGPALENLGIDKALRDLSADELKLVADEIARMDSHAGKIDAVGDAFRGLDDPLTSAAEAAVDLKTALDALIEPAITQERAVLAWKESLATLNDDLDENSRSLSRNSTEGRLNRNAILDRVESLMASVEADMNAGAEADQLAAKLKNGKRSIIEAAEAAGLNAREVRRMVNQMELTPKLIRTLIEVDGVNKALSDIASITGAISRIPLHPVISPIVQMANIGSQLAAAAAANNRGFAEGGTVPRRAEGGSITRKDLVLASGGPVPWSGPVPNYDDLAGVAA